MNIVKKLDSSSSGAETVVGLTPELSSPEIDSALSQLPGSEECLDLHVVVLNNYLRRHHVAVYQELAKRVRKLTVLLSVQMEPDRAWDPEWDGLDVRIQKNWMFTSWWRHPSGFSEPNFIHIPTDSIRRLRKLKPDVVLSYEMGMRTLLSSVYRKLFSRAPLVMVGNMSEHIEKERGLLRRMVRKLICFGADYFTYNGPSCKRYLESLNIPEDKLFHFPYCIDEATVNVDSDSSPVVEEEVRRLLYCGAISERKGILQFTQALSQWCDSHPQQLIEFSIAGTGPLQSEVAKFESENLSINFLGNCDLEQLRNAYGSVDISVFPTLADEWGLVPIEAMASGLPVLGSKFAQSVEACCVDSVNSWVFDPTKSDTILNALDRSLLCSRVELQGMREAARDAVAHISAANSAKLVLDMVQKIAKPKNATNP